jgi:hypothetical protein
MPAGTYCAPDPMGVFHTEDELKGHRKRSRHEGEVEVEGVEEEAADVVAAVTSPSTLNVRHALILSYLSLLIEFENCQICTKKT